MADSEQYKNQYTDTDSTEKKTDKNEQPKVHPVVRKRRLMKKVQHYTFLFLELLLVIILAFGFSTFFCRKVTQTEGSMEPNLCAGESFFVNSLAYTFGSPKRGDVIAFTTGNEDNEVVHIKRIIGLPGETVQIVDGQILINGTLYLEDGNYPTILNAGRAESVITLDSDEYFVLGDNRNGSEDSRYSNIGNVKTASILGRVWLRIDPLTKFGLVS